MTEALSTYQKAVNFKNIMKFTIPTMVMALIQSTYVMIDGMFISNIIGTEALSGLTLISPYFTFVIAIAAMFASGGSALVMKKMGEGKDHDARAYFTMLMIVNVIVGAVIMLLGFMFLKSLVTVLGANPAVTQYCYEYMIGYLPFVIPAMLFSNLQIYVIASGASAMSLISALVGGFTNVVLDYLFIKVLGMGMAGAAIATGMGMVVPSIVVLIYFCNKKHLIHFAKPKYKFKVLLKTMTNGFSEFSGNLVGGVVMLMFNATMLQYAGENGVAASTIIFYVFGVMSALYMGYAYGVAPMYSFHYGAGNYNKMRQLNKISLLFIGIVGVVTTILSILGTEVLVGIFVDSTEPAYNLAMNGNVLFSMCLLIVGFNTFASGFFTALSNGLVSAIISFCRTFIFLAGAILLLPMVWEINGLWLSVPIAELLTLIVAGIFFIALRKKYQY